MGRAATIARQIGWYWGTLMGDNHYRRYVEHRAKYDAHIARIGMSPEAFAQRYSVPVRIQLRRLRGH